LRQPRRRGGAPVSASEPATAGPSGITALEAASLIVVPIHQFDWSRFNMPLGDLKNP